MIRISNNIIQEARNHLEKARGENLPQRDKIEIEYKDFLELLTIECELVLIKHGRSVDTKYVIDDDNREVIVALYLYITGDDRFKEFCHTRFYPELDYSLNKGILLQGVVGCGKTILMTGFCNLITRTTKRVVQILNCYGVEELIQTDVWEKWPIFIDDIGKEEQATKSYGAMIRPLIEFYFKRSAHGSLNFGTTNYKMETLEEKYTSHIKERILESMNVIMLPGKSRRAMYFNP